MKIDFRPDKTLREIHITVSAPEMTDEVRRVLSLLSGQEEGVLNGYSERGIERLKTDAIVRIYAENQKIYAETEKGRFLLRARLYELEERLDPARFVRISNSEIVASRHILRLDASLTGTICLHMDNGSRAYASRRYVQALKKHFDL